MALDPAFRRIVKEHADRQRQLGAPMEDERIAPAHIEVGAAGGSAGYVKDAVVAAYRPVVASNHENVEPLSVKEVTLLRLWKECIKRA